MMTSSASKKKSGEEQPVRIPVRVVHDEGDDWEAELRPDPATEKDDPEEPGEESAATVEPTVSERLTELEARLEQSHAREKRLLADLDNYRKRTERTFAERTEQRKRELAADLLEVIDDLDRAVEHTRVAQEVNGNALLAGIEATRAKLIVVMERHGCKPIRPLGEVFDPTRHEAMALVEHPDSPEGTVAEVLRTGWVDGDVLLRPAQVLVAKRAEAPAS